jgi:serine/threonine-protein kinase
VLRPHAQGGLGQVSVAFDEQLHREVALKQIRPDRLDTPSARQRFLNEAEVTGQLEHPGIVPVYSLDRDEAGEPYYAMRFVQGRTLAEAIRDYHSNPTPLVFNVLLQRFVAVCQAVAYAHSKRIIHRDLKPANVLVGDYGETLLVDWGLAKRMGSTIVAGGDIPSAPEARRDAPVVAATTDPTPPQPEGGLTEVGQALGTPAYMSPEQARGDQAVIGPSTDIYALGAILYQLLTGRSPYQGRSAGEVIAEVRHGPPQAPGQVRRSVPRGLEAVCLKAMARQPGERYATAAELAAEVERWLADEPVRAYPEPWPDRARRWARRHRPLVTGAAALLVTAVLALAVGIVLVSREQRRADEARLDAEASERRTREALLAVEKQERRTREALDTLSDHFVERMLQRKDDLSEEDRAFLRRVLGYYEGFATDAGHNEQGRRAVAVAYGRVGSFQWRLGEHKPAEEGFRRAAALFAALADDFPAEPEYRAGAHRNRHNLATLFWALNRGEEAVAILRDLIPERRKLADEFPDRSRYRTDLASSLNNLGTILKERGDRDGAERPLGEAVQARRQLVAGEPGAAEYRAELAESLNNLGILYVEAQNFSAAEPLLREAIGLRRELADEFPRKPEYRNRLARSHNNLAVLLNRLGQPEQAAEAYRAAMTIRRKLASEFPTVPEYRSDLAGTLNNLAVVLKKQGHHREAEDTYQEALAIQERLAADFPESLLYAVALGNSYSNLGNLARDTGQHKAAVGWYTKAIPTLEGVLAKDPRQVTAKQFLRTAYSGRAQSRAELRQDADAVKDWDRVLALDPGPRRDEYRLFRALSMARAGATAAALAEMEALVQEPKLAAKFPGWVLFSAARVWAVVASASAEPALAAQYADRAVAFLRQAREVGYFKNAVNVEELKHEPDLDPVRTRDDFKQLLADLTGGKK